MDASFEANRPHCFVVSLGLIGNCRVPAGLAVSLTEKAQSYHVFHDALIQADLSLFLLLKDLPILNDFGSGLTSLAGAGSKHSFLCYRHVRQRQDSRTYLAIFARQLVFIGSQTEPYKTRADLRENLKFAVELRIVTVEGLYYLCGFFGMNLRAPDDGEIDWFQDQALWRNRCSSSLEWQRLT
jgi:hypothetical protein